MLEIDNLTVVVDGKPILDDIHLSIGEGETQVLFGPNGSGKTTLLMAIMGFPRYRVTRGNIVFKGKDVTGLPLDERARLGIGMSFQRPPAVRGVRTRDMVRASLGNREDGLLVERVAQMAGLTELLERDINLGFSGGEIKRSELMQLLAQKPTLVLLDEPESGVDLVNVALVGKLINELLDKDSPIRARKRAGLIITHSGHILDYVNACKGYVMLHGRIGCSGDPRDILAEIRTGGYEECVRCFAGSMSNRQSKDVQ